MFVVSERSVDGGWHHVHVSAEQLRRRICTYACWSTAVPDGLAAVDAVAPAAPLMFVSLAGAVPASHQVLNCLAGAATGEVLFEPDAATEWRASGATNGQFRESAGQDLLVAYETRAMTDMLTPLEREALDPRNHASFGPDIRLDVGWRELAPYAGKVWQQMMPLLPFRTLRHCPLLWPGVIAYSQSHIGETTVSDLMSCNGRWEFPDESAPPGIDRRPGLEDLYDVLSETPDGRTAAGRLGDMAAAGFDSICIQERHLARDQRRKVGEALDRVAVGKDQCLSLSPLIRATPVASMGGSGWMANFARQLGVEHYGDLGRYCFGLRIAREYPARKPEPRHVVGKLTRAVERMMEAAQPKRGRGRPRRAHSEPPAQVELPKDPSERTLVSALRRDMEAMHPMHRKVLERRLGLGRAPQTLAEIGQSIGRTRERVRQLAMSACSELGITRSLFVAVVSAIEQRLKDSGHPMCCSESPAPGIECELERHELHVLRYLIEEWASDALQMHQPANGEPLVMSATEHSLEDIQAMVVREVQGRPPDPGLRVQHVRAQPFFAALPSDVRGGFAAAITDPEGPYGSLLKPRRAHAMPTLRAVLEASPRPMAVDEAVAAASAQYGVQIDPRHAHACLIKMAFPLGEQEYGLRKHLAIPEDLARRIAVHVDGFASECEEWRMKSVRERLTKTDVGPELSGISGFELAAAVRLHSRKLVYVSRLVFRVGEYKPRTMGAQAALHTLERAGRPLRAQEIMDAVRREIPGITYQVRQSQDVARLNVGLWGLRDRDFNIDDQALESIYDWLAAHIKAQGQMHFAELEKCPAFAEAAAKCPALSALTVADLAHATRRFRLGPQRILTIRESA
jgi:hypothetical protein